MRRFSICVTALAAVLSAALPAAAENAYPNRPIKILVPIPPGGAPDVVARLVGDYLSKAVGQPVVIENHTGANGNIAGEAVAKAPPDGYTLILAADSGIVINPHVYSKMTFDPMKDLVPITSVATNQFVLAVNPKVPVKTLQEFVAYAKKAKPPLAFASGGVGSQHFFAMEQLKQRAGFTVLNVTYRGGSPAMQATIAGETQVLFAGGESAGQFEAGTLRPLAVSGKERSKRLPDVRIVEPAEPPAVILRKLLHVAPHDLDEEQLAEPRQHIHSAGALVARLLNRVPDRRRQPLLGLDIQRDGRSADVVHGRSRRRSLGLRAIRMDDHQVWQRAQQRIEALIAVQKAAQELARLTQPVFAQHDISAGW